MIMSNVEKPSFEEVVIAPNEGLATTQEVRQDTNEALLAPRHFHNQVLTPETLEDRHIDEVSDYFRYIFNNDWPEFVVCPPCDRTQPGGMKLSAGAVYGTDKHVPLEVLDQSPKIPDCPHCAAPMQVFHDPQKTREKMEKKLRPDGYVSFLREQESDKIYGFAYGYGTTLKNGFDLEWGNPHGYMKNPNPEYNRDFDFFLERLNATITDTEFRPDTEIFLWNCIALSKEARGGSNFLTVMRGLFNALPPEKRDQRIVAEVIKNTTAHGLFKTVGAIDIPDYLEGEEVSIVFKVGETTDRFNLSPKEFYKLRKKILDEK